MVSTPDVPDASIDAVPTRYGDTTFRSRLEADWAATLDGNGIRWEYEPETITLCRRTGERAQPRTDERAQFLMR
ncbi:hypothetical protein ABZX85_25475 [Streptomyces sp. NPDC004539]|uniref:hypothetical protein n=1 Tax=Streptomyces sp. NPDC004539 TaxID=3154280 RepID=UPI0033B4F273